MTISNYITNATTGFGSSALTLRSFGISFAKIIKILIKLHKTMDRCVIKSVLSLLIYQILSTAQILSYNDPLVYVILLIFYNFSKHNIKAA
jgi:hypothetical protein